MSTDEKAQAFETFKRGQVGRNTNIWGLKDVQDAFTAGREYEAAKAQQPVELPPATLETVRYALIKDLESVKTTFDRHPVKQAAMVMVNNCMVDECIRIVNRYADALKASQEKAPKREPLEPDMAAWLEAKKIAEQIAKLIPPDPEAIGRDDGGHPEYANDADHGDAWLTFEVNRLLGLIHTQLEATTQIEVEQPVESSPLTLEQVWPCGEAEVEAFKTGEPFPDIERLIRAYTGCTFGESAQLGSALRPYLQQPEREWGDLVEKVAKIAAFNDYHENGLETLFLLTDVMYARNRWPDYMNGAKKCVDALTRIESQQL
ncbi:MAG: hypothetical protein K8U57_27585 [Planctomycetes bacterium]|nr:hypothetical protein [Planctomycetota bacterium]